MSGAKLITVTTTFRVPYHGAEPLTTEEAADVIGPKRPGETDEEAYWRNLAEEEARLP